MSLTQSQLCSMNNLFPTITTACDADDTVEDPKSESIGQIPITCTFCKNCLMQKAAESASSGLYIERRSVGSGNKEEAFN